MATILSMIICIVFLFVVGTLLFVSNVKTHEENYQNERIVADYELTDAFATK